MSASGFVFVFFLMGQSDTSEKIFQSLVWSYIPGCQPISERSPDSTVVNVNYELLVLISGGSPTLNYDLCPTVQGISLTILMLCCDFDKSKTTAIWSGGAGGQIHIQTFNEPSCFQPHFPSLFQRQLCQLKKYVKLDNSLVFPLLVQKLVFLDFPVFFVAMDLHL